MRLLICAGASGGGVYPALAVLEALESEDAQVLWVGSLRGMESDLVKRRDIPFAGIPAAGVHGVSLRALPGNFVRILRGWWEARKLIQQFKPDVLFFTGGYVAVPVALAGFKIPTVLFIPDIEPGLALKVLARFADQITLSHQASVKYFADTQRLTVTGYPTRTSLASWTRGSAQKTLGLDPTLPTLLVFGGSQGARSINTAILEALEALLPELQIVHISGRLDWERVRLRRAVLPGSKRARYLAYPYLYEEMGAALAAADLVVSRAGASTLGEFPLFGLPAILVPYPYAWQYQKVNAETLVEQGAAVMIQDGELEEKLQQTVLKLIRDPNQLRSMRQAMSALARPHAGRKIASILGSSGGLLAKRGKTDG